MPRPRLAAICEPTAVRRTAGRRGFSVSATESRMNSCLSRQGRLAQRETGARERRVTEREGGGLLRPWLRAAFRRWQRRKMIAALEAMDDRLLRDIGVHRCNIPRVVDGLIDRDLPAIRFAPPLKAIGACDDRCCEAA